MTEINEIMEKRYLWLKQHNASENSPGIALEIFAVDRIGLLADITGYFTRNGFNLSYFQSWIDHADITHVLIQTDAGKDTDKVIREIEQFAGIKRVILRPTYSSTFGKRVIIMGGGAQVAQVAGGAITEADRHNIRGEKISVDTIAIIGEESLSRAIRAVGRLHRAGILVLAGALMGGEISEAVNELRTVYGIPVMALKMAGSVGEAADLVVTDPTMAGVMAVMLISHVGKFNLHNVKGETF